MMCVTRAHTTRSRTIKKKARDTEKRLRKRVRVHEQRCCAVQQNKRIGREERDIVRSCCLSPLFPGKNEGQGGGGVFVVEREKKSRRSSVFFFHLLSSFQSHFSTLSREAVHAGREREREREREYIYIYTHTHHIQRIYSYVIFCVIFESSIVHNVYNDVFREETAAEVILHQSFDEEDDDTAAAEERHYRQYNTKRDVF